jgi:outer membrane protein TolC
MKTPLLVFIMVFAGSTTTLAQDSLNFDEALRRTLANNYDIRIAQIDEEIATNSAERGANGYLPRLSGTGAYNWTYYQGNNQLRTQDVAFNANNSYTYNAGLTLSYTVFEGNGRHYRYEQAVGNRILSSLELRSMMENTILQLSQAFHEVARLQEQNISLDSTLSISRQRLQRAEYGYEFGQFTQLDILNAQVDLNTDSINLLNSRQQEENFRRNLNLIMGEPISSEFKVVEDVQLRTLMTPDEVVNSALENGSVMRTVQQFDRNADLAIGASRSTWYPNLGVSGGYQYRGLDDPNGAFLIGNSSHGPAAGFNLNWTLFDGGNVNQIKNAKLLKESSSVAVERTQQQVRTDALNAHGTYRNALFVLEASAATVETAKDNFERSSESFRLGQIGSVDFRQAQLNYLTAVLQLSRARYDAKNAELQVLALMGVLVE